MTTVATFTSIRSRFAVGVFAVGLLTVAVVLASLAFGSAPAFAEGGGCPTESVYSSCAPGWEIVSHMYPTNVAPGHRALVVVYPYNVGAANSEVGAPITVTDLLPEGVTAIGVKPAGGNATHSEWECAGIGTSVVRCTNNPITLPSFFGGGIPTEEYISPKVDEVTPAIEIETMVTGAPRTAVNRASIAGGGALGTASTSSPFNVSTTPASFGVANWDVWFSNADGTLDTQAGSHPYNATFDLEINTDVNPGRLGPYNDPSIPLTVNFFVPAGGELRNVTVDLPAGFAGDPTAAPQCPRERFDGGTEGEGKCPPNTALGVVTTYLPTGVGDLGAQIFNLTPPRGVVSQFGFEQYGNPDFFNTSVRTGGDSGLVTHADNSPQGRGVAGAILTLWGVPGDPSHNLARCGVGYELLPCPAGAGVGLSKTPYLTLPTACGAQQPFMVQVNEWQHPDVTAEKTVQWHDSNNDQDGLNGCEHMSFNPSLSTEPDTTYADTPAGLSVDVRPEVGGLIEPTGLSTADIQNTTVTLPEGVVINPGQAAGLEACKSGDVPGGDDLPLPGENGEEERFAGPADCPNASRVGTVTINTPLIEGAAEKQLQGAVYVLESEPPELKLLITASADGVYTKLIGIVHLDEQTGRLQTTFSGTPQLPFSEFKLSFSGGAQAALDTPTRCGIYTTTSDFESWASPLLGDAFPIGEFAISKGTDGAPCPSASAPLPFTPSLNAGSTTDQAGGFTSFSLLLQSSDDQQRIEKLQFKVPSGLLGMISKVPLCPEPEASAGTCSSASQIGHTTVASGPGPYPLVVPQPGQPRAPIYLTGPYKGAPFGLSIVVPLVVGPFTLPTQVVRAKIEVDSLTSQITVTTDPLPQIISGVPTDLRTVNAVIDRPEFMFNPTSCAPMSFAGTAWGTPPPGVGGPDSTAPISTPFQMGSCRSLVFKPNLVVSTSGKTSRQDGASLDAKIVYPITPLEDNQASSQSNIRSIKVDLPRQLPSRLTTLQKACTSATFEANPANCPPDSRVGIATAVTPVLPVPLTGPAYFVSYGGAKFPELVFALQGYGVTVYVHGETFISKAGITSSTFRQVPDVPIYSFDLQLPEGPYSALAANGNLCKSDLIMPTSFIAQNNATLKQNTHISVSGCAKEISVLHHSVKAGTVTIAANVPSAGKLLASGSGLSRAVKSTGKAGTLTLALKLSARERALLKSHPGRKLKVAVKLVFTPTHGQKLSAGVTVNVG
ncbi:MAG TPA: hypothetical protein VIJ50_10120 [Solirubrobacteraceae bacterium]